MPRVLVVTYYFPPVGGVGVQRTLKFVKYLPACGWQPIVVTPRDPGYGVRDVSLLAEVPAGLEVHRTLSLEPARLTLMASRRLHGRAGAGPGDSGPAVGAGSGREARGASGRVSSRRLLHAAVDGWNAAWGAVLFPDPAVAWAPSAVLAGTRAARRRGADVIYSSALPISAHLVAAAIKAETGRPWVADFRDPWVGNAFGWESGMRARAARRLERWLVERADRVVLAMAALRDDFARRYPDLAERFVYIPNGYDRADLVGIEPARPDSDRFHLLFAGSLYRPGELEAFLGGVERLVERRPAFRDRLRVEFVGRVNEENLAVARAFTGPGGRGLGDVVRFEGFVPRREALSRMAGADALLQLMPDIPGAEMFAGGKLFEYLAFDRPILAVMPAGEGRRIVEGLPCGYAADVEPGSVAQALERIVEEGPGRACGANDPDGRYDRLNLTRELAGVLDAVLSA